MKKLFLLMAMCLLILPASASAAPGCFDGATKAAACNNQALLNKWISKGKLVAPTAAVSIDSVTPGTPLMIDGHGFDQVNHIQIWTHVYGTSQPMMDFFPNYAREWIATGNYGFGAGIWQISDTHITMPPFDAYESFLFSGVDKVIAYHYDEATYSTVGETGLACWSSNATC